MREEEQATSKSHNHHSKSRGHSRASATTATRLVTLRSNIQRQEDSCRMTREKSETRNFSVNVTKVEEAYNALIISLSDRESLIDNSNTSFHATGDLSKLQNYVNKRYNNVYLGDDKQCNIVGIGDVQLNLSNEIILNLKNARHVKPKTQHSYQLTNLRKTGYTLPR